jgi:hypothetical protein
MTVKELIEHLQQFDDEMEVLIWEYDSESGSEFYRPIVDKYLPEVMKLSEGPADKEGYRFITKSKRIEFPRKNFLVIR